MLTIATLAPGLFGQQAPVQGKASEAAVQGKVANDAPLRGKVANPHGSLDVACENCHTTTAWKPIRRQPEFNHNTQTNFALLGLHKDVACTSCHVNLVFAKAPTRCSDCHADLHRRQFGANCQDCHSVRGWSVEISAIRDHNNRFPLIGAHAVATCDDCHKGASASVNNAAAAGTFTGLSTQCVSCHLKDYQTATPLNHIAANLPTTCETCHLVTVWQNAKFNHNQFTSFALTGAHATVACIQCHVGNRFAGTPTLCYGCHANDFTTTTNPNHVAAGFPTTCDSCHTTLTWTGANFDHSTTGFALTGLHASVACAQCHLNNKFVGIATACNGCHMPDFQSTTNPNHVTANFSTVCEGCHNTSGWQNATFDHNLSPFPLTGAHTTVACAQCHLNGNFTTAPLVCSGCHMADFNGTTNPNHVQAGFPTTCDSCHTTAAGWGGATFNHTSTGFTLTGAHTSLQCTQCHNAQFGNYSIANGACANCHMTDFNGTTNPNHAQAGFPTTCDSCHTTVAGWGGATFNHTSTGFALTGAHTSLQCQQCHNAQFGNYSIANGNCANCHMNDFNTATNPNHKSAGFPLDCTVCHTTVQWMGATFNHTSTGFALTGAHVSLQCQQCHTAQFGNYSIPNGNCWNCHQTDYNTATNPNHVAANFPQDCTGCHTTATWTGATFNHTSTGFTLTGAHTSLQCAQCHNAQFGNYSISSGNCGQCHMTDYNGATNPNHVQAGFPTTCDTCHTTVAGWGGATFNHTSTGFALTGGHTSLQCQQCHNAQFGGYSIASGACWNCHQSDYNATNNPPHKATNFPQDCSGCHTTAPGWGGAVFNHAATGFALVGLHASQQCTACHVNNNYTLSSGACIGCHQTDFTNANNPPHVSAGFPQDCTICHGSSITNWTSATFNHNTTGFTLTNAHTTLQCQQCHNAQFGNYSITSGACANCHMTDYNGTTNPSHKAANFPVTCDSCHTTVAGWGGATFNHTSTGFALTNAHTSLQCSQCHNAQFGNYSITSGACGQCHMADFNGTTNPNHVQAGFPTTCDSCHTTIAGWGGATFNHTSTGFALTNAHTSLQCTQCHNAQFGNYSIQNGACANCHMTDYNGTTNPSHKAANFPTTCDTCHTTVAGWGGATFNHTSTGFALTNAHASLACTSCHNAQFGNYSITSGNCGQCHMTDYNGTTNPNHVQAGFPTTCDSCHTTVAGWGGATFNHATTGFTLTNAHTSLACTSCHNAQFGNYNITSGACAQCHMTDYNGTTSPPHVAANFPTTCDSCHTTVAGWGGATFTHPSTPLALTGYHLTMLNSNQCTACHTATAGYTISSGACINCHQADYTGTTNPPHATQGFPTTCDSCHTFTDWTGATFNHTSTGFALTGDHMSIACTACHTATVGYTIQSALCYNCHSTEYNSTTSPPHATAGFPQDCSQCHSTNATTPPWAGATFTHPSTPLALTGYHATMLTNNQCSLCHTGGGAAAYTNTPSTCTPCHTSDYNGTTSPPHSNPAITSFFPQTCSTCHSFTDWSGAQFLAHDTSTPGPFPIYSGRHNGAWQNCTDCHPSSADYSSATVTCVTGSCHVAPGIDNVGEHKSYMTSHSLTVTAFNQGSTCLICHRSGNGG